jgi:hypothetical protein
MMIFSSFVISHRNGFFEEMWTVPVLRPGNLQLLMLCRLLVEH